MKSEDVSMTDSAEVAKSESGGDVVQRIKALSKKVADESLARRRAEAEEHHRRSALPNALAEAVSWGSTAKDGEQTLDFVRHLRVVLAILRADGHAPRIDRKGSMPDLARRMLARLDNESPECNREVAQWLHEAIEAQSINLDDWVHQRPVPSFDDLDPADRIHYFRDGVGDEPASLWGDLATVAGVPWSGRFCVARADGGDAERKACESAETVRETVVATEQPLDLADIRAALDLAVNAIVEHGAETERATNERGSPVQRELQFDSPDGFLRIVDTAEGEVVRVKEGTVAAVVIRTILERAREKPTSVLDLAPFVDHETASFTFAHDEDRSQRTTGRRKKLTAKSPDGLSPDDFRKLTTHRGRRGRPAPVYSGQPAWRVIDLWSILVRSVTKSPKAKSFRQRWIHFSAKDGTVHVVNKGVP